MKKIKFIVMICMSILLSKSTVYNADSASVLVCGIDSLSSIEVNPMSPEIIYSMGIINGLYISIDGGNNWNTAVVGEKKVFNTSPISIDPKNPQIIYAGEYKSIDGGKTWSTMNVLGGTIQINLGQILVHPNNTKILYARAGKYGIYKSNNSGESWFAINSDKLGNCLALTVDGNNPNILYGYFEKKSKDIYGRELPIVGELYKSIDSGATWISLLPAIEIRRLAVDPANSSNVYAGTVQQGVYRSLNGGKQWNTVKRGLPEGVSINFFTFDPVNTEMMYVGTSRGLFYSTDKGDNWNSCSNDLNAYYVRALAINPQNPAIMYIVVPSEGILKTTDSGKTWNLANKGILVDTEFPTCP